MRDLRDRQIHLRRKIFLQRKMFSVADHADNLAHLCGLITDSPARLHLFAYRILPGKILLREALVNNNDWLGVEPIGVCEKSAANQRNAHGLEIIGARETSER